jgi:hypothetical protein
VTATATSVELPIQVRLADGSIYDGPLSAERHRALQLGMLHERSAGYVEIAAGPRPAGGKTQITSRSDPDHYLPGGATGTKGWLEALLDLAAREAAKDRFEVFVGVAPRTDRAANKQYVTHSQWLWVDVDQPEELPTLWAFLQQCPAHLVVESGGSGGAHAYWRLSRALQARTVPEGSGETVEWIERANDRLINHLGRWETERNPDWSTRRVFVGADRTCKDRSRVMRLAGTVNYKTGRHARIVRGDLALPGYDAGFLVGQLPDMAHSKAAGQRQRSTQPGRNEDPYKRISPVDYFKILAGIDVGSRRLVSCPHVHHDDSHPSCSVGDTEEGWWCHGCGHGGAIYDLASAVLGGPTGMQLRGEHFRAARQRVRDRYGDLT